MNGQPALTAAQATEALRREALVLQTAVLMAPEGEALSLNAAAARLGEPVANLCRYRKAYDGSLESLAPKQPGHSGAHSLRARFVAQLGEEAVALVEKRVAGLALDLSPAIAGGSRRLSDGLAWRTVARQADCPAPIREYFASDRRRSKHSIAPSLRERTRPGPLLDARHHGHRAYGLRGPWQPRELDILPGDIFSSDDTTPIWAWWVPWPKSDRYPHGVKLLQGQFLPVIDVASQHILCYALIAREQSSYRAADIWRLMGRVHSLVGLPRLGWQKERGSWEANLIEGERLESDAHGLRHTQRVGGLRMLPSNLTPWHLERLDQERSAQWKTLRTFTSYLPKSKSVEGIFQRLQKFEGTLFGTLGRSQQRRPFEKATRIYNACRAGGARSPDPRLHFLSGAELMQRLNACIEAHENESIEGEVFRGQPPETWLRGLQEHGPLLAEPPEGRWLMCSDWALVKVSRGMVRVRRVDEVTDQPVSYFFSSPQFCGALDGLKVLIYFNRDAYREPAHILLPGAGGECKYLGTASYIERVGMFLDRSSEGHELRHEQAAIVTTLYSDLAAHIPSRQVPPEVQQRRCQGVVTAEIRYHVPSPMAGSHRSEKTERISKTKPTGLPGISYFTTASNRRDGTVQRFYSVYHRTADGRRKCSRFCLDTLGDAEALRRAIEARGSYENKVASQAHTQRTTTVSVENAEVIADEIASL